MQVFLKTEDYKTRLIENLVKMSLATSENMDDNGKYKGLLRYTFCAIYGAYAEPAIDYRAFYNTFTFDKNGKEITDEDLKNITEKECDEFNTQQFYINKRMSSKQEGIDGVLAEIKPYNKKQDINDYRKNVMKVLVQPFIGSLDSIAQEAYEKAYGKKAPK